MRIFLNIFYPLLYSGQSWDSYLLSQYMYAQVQYNWRSWWVALQTLQFFSNWCRHEWQQIGLYWQIQFCVRIGMQLWSRSVDVLATPWKWIAAAPFIFRRSTGCCFFFPGFGTICKHMRRPSGFIATYHFCRSARVQCAFLWGSAGHRIAKLNDEGHHWRFIMSKSKCSPLGSLLLFRKFVNFSNFWTIDL